MAQGLLGVELTALTPYIVHCERGKGNHETDGIKIGVAYAKPSFIIDPPGTHVGVQVGLEVIIDGLKRGLGKEELAAALSDQYVELLKELIQRDKGFSYREPR